MDKEVMLLKDIGLIFRSLAGRIDSLTRIILIFLLLTVFTELGMAGILNSKHNLSVTGTGSVKATHATRVCVFCHIPHNASPSGPLWNRQDPGQHYIPYTSSTVESVIGQPTGASLLCLSCHDGTIAIGDVRSLDVPIDMTSGSGHMPLGSRSNLGTDLSDDHPVSFVYNESVAAADGKLISPSLLNGQVRLDAKGEMQCTSCHDAHDNQYGDFLVMDAGFGHLCRVCHIVGHGNSAHLTSTATWSGVGNDPWPETDWTTVQENACYNCHTSHSAAGPRLLRFAREEDNCLVCHNGQLAKTDIEREFQKPYAHPVDISERVHDPKENILVADRHVECSDCHDGHESEESPDKAKSLLGVSGIDINGVALEQATEWYQVCFRCHGDSQDGSIVRTNRLVSQSSSRSDFSLSNPSYHPVAGPGRNMDVPSLIPPLTATSTIGCDDCHNSDDSATGIEGPHGSNYPALLERQNISIYPNTESPAAYALCYKCHDRNSILADESFSAHREHIVGEPSGNQGLFATPCNVCHDPHGVSRAGRHSGTKLINFDSDVVTPNSAGQLYFESSGRFQGSCYLSCHGKEHNPCSYGIAGGSNC